MGEKKNILYISSLCSPDLLNYIFSTSSEKPGQAVQKFHRLLVEGLAMNNEICIVETLSTIPVSPHSHKKRIWNNKSETIGSINFNYIPTINLPILKNIMVLSISFIKVLLWNLSKLKKDKVVICDPLNFNISASALLACKLTGVKTIAILTDLPVLMNPISYNKKKIKYIVYDFIVSKLLLKFNGYILLTSQMNQIVNPKHKPYLVMEGLVDTKMETSLNLIENKAKTRILIYAGGIYEKYGIKKLIEAFMRLEDDNLRLNIYGSGEMEKDMPYYMQTDSRIQYQGIINNNIVVEKLITATLLINPRPSHEEFTKYSFPSKNMEYMVSGTPLVTTRLPGMPQEYEPFVYLFEDESVEGMHLTLKLLLSKPPKELHKFGLYAKNWVLNEKSNYKQSLRVLEFINEI